MKDKIKYIIELAENPIFSQDSDSPNYLSDGEMLDIVLSKLKDLISSSNSFLIP